MPFVRPTRSELIAHARTEIDRIPGADSRLRRSFFDALARMQGFLTDGLYGFLAYIARQAFADTAESEFLRRQAAIYGVQPIPAEFAQLEAEATGTNGATIAAGTVVRRADSTEYEVTSDATIASGTATVALTARKASASGTADVGVSLMLLSPIPGVVSTLEVTAVVLEGRDEEDDESLRQRLIDRLSNPPAGGTARDIIGWILAGITEATDVWVHTHQFGPGTAGVAVMFYDREDPFPTMDDLDAIQAILDENELVGAEWTAYELDPVAVNFTINLPAGTPESVETAIEAEVRDVFRRDARPGSLADDGVTPAPILISRLREAISSAAGESDHVLVTPNANIDLAGDLTEISRPGTFTFGTI